MTICIGLIAFKFLPNSPILVLIISSIGAIVCFATFPSLATRKVFKVVFLSAFVLLATFALTLNVGAFESMSLMNDSWIDISHCAMIFHLGNTGLTRWHILQVQVGNVTFSINPFSSGQISEYVESSNDAYLLLYYCHGVWQWIPPNYAASIQWDATNPFNPTFPEELKYSVNSQIVPSTYIANSTYQVTFYTGSAITHTFEVQATATLNEQLSIQGSSSAINNSAHVSIKLNNSGRYYSYIYRFQINNVTFRMDHFLMVPPSIQDPVTFSLSFNQYGLTGYSRPFPNIQFYPDGNLTSTALERETPVNVTAMTMANHLFTGQLTIENP
jgi:hypothetical protein